MTLGPAAGSGELQTGFMLVPGGLMRAALVLSPSCFRSGE
jgi:hypothetical protein